MGAAGRGGGYGNSGAWSGGSTTIGLGMGDDIWEAETDEGG